MKRWAVLLRAVNVGGRTLAMADLRAMLESLGFADVATLLASGNALISTEQRDSAALEAALEQDAAARFGFPIDFLVRDGRELRDIMAANPFPDAARERPNRLVVLFHRTPPDPALLDALAERYSLPERLHARGRELYIDYRDGQARSRLQPAMAKLGFPKVATARNWNTVGKLAARLAPGL
ncbi:DUF1697 domain-containing protein [Sphingosinithalassobacter sp. LHW66-3]|uniref:DUF1697 domain-containing protein n=1 Tax=Sphingosinithalassobacter sp. LHW66-3 TaxID=3424718 RepID=UPI003D6B83C1